MKTTTTSCNTNQSPAQNSTSGILSNSPDAGEEMPPPAEFIPTLFELELLARHWLNTRLEIDLIYFLDQQTGSTESGLDRLAEERMEIIREGLGEDNYAKFAADVELQVARCNSRPIVFCNIPHAAVETKFVEFPDDADGLESVSEPKHRLLTGYVYEVNGQGGSLSAGFVPIQFELEIITSRWLATQFYIEYFCHLANETGDIEFRLIRYSKRRLAKLRQALGDENYFRILAEVDSDFEQRFGRDEWRAFRIPEK